uniref:Uncharacterized protein n=1 Tax=Panagrolaimus davidi TaxID=227884 RepID=A0A914QZF4_9BILA
MASNQRNNADNNGIPDSDDENAASLNGRETSDERQSYPRQADDPRTPNATLRQQLLAQSEENERAMQSLQLRQQQVRQQATVQRRPSIRSTNRQSFQQSLPAPRQNFAYSMPHPPIPPFQPYYGYPPPPPYVFAPSTPSTTAASIQPNIRQPNQAPMRLPSTASDHSIAPPTPTDGQRQPITAPIRRTANSQVPVGTFGIHDKIRHQCAKAARGVVSAHGYDAVCHLAFRQYFTFVKFKSGMVLKLLPQQLQPFITSEVADTSVEFACEPNGAINQLDTNAWAHFLLQTIDATFTGFWKKSLLFSILDSFVNLRFCYFQNIQWPSIWMNDLRQHLPLVAVLVLDARQSANSTFLSCFKHITLGAHERQHQYSILFLQVTDFPTGAALDDYLLHVDQYVNERALILVNDFADDAYLRVLRPRGFNVASIVHYDADYILFETQINGVYFTIGFLVPENRQPR